MRRLFTCPTCHRTAKIRLAPVGCVCGYVLRDIDDLPEVAETIPPEPQPLGVGATLSEINRARYGVTSCTACIDLARTMDKLGPDGCRENLSDLAEQYQSNAIKLNWRQLMEAATHPIASATDAAKAASQGLAFFEGRILEACEAVDRQTAAAEQPREMPLPSGESQPRTRP